MMDDRVGTVVGAIHAEATFDGTAESRCPHCGQSLNRGFEHAQQWSEGESRDPDVLRHRVTA